MSFAIDLEGRRALITGAGQGVGLAIARALADAGAVVVVNDIRPEKADEAVGVLRAAGGKAEALPFDVTDWAQVAAAVEGSGGVDILVNNAGNAGVEGFTRLVDFVETDPADWQRFFAVNLFGVMHCTRAALPSMIESGWGRVITIISDASRRGEAKLAAYGAAKAGAAGFCRSIAREVGRHSITVNCVSLGNVATPDTAPPPPDTLEAHERERAFLRPYVIRRRGQPADVAGMVTYLASPLAEWITGQTYAVNGGYTFSL
ncbi:MAG TPA: SDR family oxidoreductase [Acidimicrobiales bacterium]|nr:SDR family oxidoreductase [Acidimicrobiales bacterium]